MATSILRTADAWWLSTPVGAVRIPTDASTTAELMADRAAIDSAAGGGDTVPIGELDLVSPITLPCRLVAQATNFASHVRDTGGDPAKTPLTFFRKASGSMTGPYGDIVKPKHVQLLDYECEIGLVLGRALPVGTEVTEDNLADYVTALVLTNDVSARDVQMLKAQFYESKSYPTFTPVGPVLVLLETGDLKRFGELRLQLRVNGELRQHSVVDGDMIFSPLQALQGLAEFQRLDVGDVILTGTPVGTAVRAPKPDPDNPVKKPAGKPTFDVFLASQADNPFYLRDGDIVESTVSTDDGAIDLGTQRNVVRYL